MLPHFNKAKLFKNPKLQFGVFGAQFTYIKSQCFGLFANKMAHGSYICDMVRTEYDQKLDGVSCVACNLLPLYIGYAPPLLCMTGRQEV